jgi:hypothetical protein
MIGAIDHGGRAVIDHTGDNAKPIILAAKAHPKITIPARAIKYYQASALFKVERDFHLVMNLPIKTCPTRFFLSGFP